MRNSKALVNVAAKLVRIAALLKYGETFGFEKARISKADLGSPLNVP